MSPATSTATTPLLDPSAEPAFTTPTTYERGSMRITTPKDRLDNGHVSWFCNDCGARRSLTTRRPDEAAALAAQWHAHRCDPLPEHWMVAPIEMPCDLCRVHTRTRSPRLGRPRHPLCAERRIPRPTTTTAAAPTAVARRPARTTPAPPARGDPRSGTT
ncbi:hypothetical protein [Embleya hyalina]|uniref:Uncharacterized protein n=1 Tax=Embleya hyalina TaxID=516124 RepID=A0A401YYY1_9ACTN|nr:hypothetical protein [Embleya hyalina]GCD99760.1 hypothetical protein EHYA_07482 [Embleya hyalina]